MKSTQAARAKRPRYTREQLQEAGEIAMRLNGPDDALKFMETELEEATQQYRRMRGIVVALKAIKARANGRR